jgi:hypothetical protein
VVAAAPAQAEPGQITLSPGFAGRYGTTCTYTVSVPANDIAGPVYFYDNNILIGGGGSQSSGGVAEVQWTPTTPGAHTLRAYQKGYGPARVVAVGVGLNLGSLCLAF